MPQEDPPRPEEFRLILTTMNAHVRDAHATSFVFRTRFRVLRLACLKKNQPRLEEFQVT